MKFHDQFTMWRSFKRMDKKEFKNLSWKDFYDEHISSSLLQYKNSPLGQKSSADLASLSLEKNWFIEGCPYYKIWPGVFDQFTSTRLDIDTRYLRPPHFSFSIYFPDIDESLLSFEADNTIFHIHSILVEHWDAEQVNKARSENRMLKTMESSFDHPIFQKLGIKDHKQNTGMIKVRVDFKSKIANDLYLSDVKDMPELKEALRKINPPCMFFRNIPILPDRTIEECIGDFVDVPSRDSSTNSIPSSVIEACFRCLVGIYFVSTGSQKVLEYDVISKHLNAYRKMREEGDKKAKQYEEKAKKKGKYGWNVGPDRKDRHLILPKGITYDEALREAGSRELLYQHTRGGHWHLYWVGMNRTKPIIKWVEETTVRKDLPIRPIKR